MENTMMSNGLRRLLIIFGALLVVSLLASGFSAVYVTLAAPQVPGHGDQPVGAGADRRLDDDFGPPSRGSQFGQIESCRIKVAFF